MKEKNGKNCFGKGDFLGVPLICRAIVLVFVLRELKFGHILCDSCTQWMRRGTLADIGFHESKVPLSLFCAPPFFLSHAKSVVCGGGCGEKIGPNLKLLSPLCVASLLFLRFISPNLLLRARSH